MTDRTASARSSPMRWLTALFDRFVAVLRDMVRIWWLAPLVPALVVVPEFIQHVVEIQIGMFDGVERAREVSDSAQRMGPGYVKVAGLILCILATVRFWGAWSKGERWYDVRGVAWKGFLIAFAILAVTMLPSLAARAWLGENAGQIVDIVIGLAVLPVYVLMVRALAGSREATLSSVYRNGWLAAVVAALFSIVIWVPLQALHGLNHTWAMGGEPALVWALMVFDSLVVGLLATGAGTALHHGLVPLGETLPTRDEPSA